MLYDALVAEPRKNDSPDDDMRSAALDRVRSLVDLWERQSAEPQWDASAALWGPEEFERIQAVRPTARTFLLVAATKITDKTILRGIKRGA